MLTVLARASLEGAVLAAGVWAIGRVVPQLPARVRTMLWWCVAAKFIVTLIVSHPVTLAILPATVVPTGTPAATSTDIDVKPAVLNRQPTHPGRSTTFVDDQRDRAFSWTTLLVGLWSVGVSISLLLTVRGWRRMRRSVTRSIAADPRLQHVTNDLAALLGLRHAIEVRMSGDVESPLVTGARVPVILVPIRFSLLSADHQRMALCHELAHIKRGDVWLGCVPAAVERFFFFHPFAHLAAREYAFWREAACDEMVLNALGTSPQSYGRLLLALGVSRQPATFSAAGAAWSFSNLKRRIVMLKQPSLPSTKVRVASALAVALGAVAIAPVRAVARTTPVTSPATIAVSAPWLDAGRLPAQATTISETATPEFSPRRHSTQEALRFVYIRNDRHTTASGSSRDSERAREFRRSGEPLLWFRLNGSEYVVRDANVLRQVDELWAPVSAVGDEQSRISATQGAVGSEQSALSAKQAALAAEQAILGAQQGVIGSRYALLGVREMQELTNEERRALDRERAELDREMRALDREMQELSKAMRAYDEPMRELSREISDWSRDIEAMGRRIEAASRKAEREMRGLVEEAIRSGAAQGVR